MHKFSFHLLPHRPPATDETFEVFDAFDSIISIQSPNNKDPIAPMLVNVFCEISFIHSFIMMHAHTSSDPNDTRYEIERRDEK